MAAAAPQSIQVADRPAKVINSQGFTPLTLACGQVKLLLASLVRASRHHEVRMTASSGYYSPYLNVLLGAVK